MVCCCFCIWIGTARINSGTIFSIRRGSDPRPLNSFKFGLDLARALVLPQTIRRSKFGLQKNTLRKIDICLDYLNPEQTVNNDTFEDEQPWGVDYHLLLLKMEKGVNPVSMKLLVMGTKRRKTKLVKQIEGVKIATLQSVQNPLTWLATIVLQTLWSKNLSLHIWMKCRICQQSIWAKT